MSRTVTVVRGSTGVPTALRFPTYTLRVLRGPDKKKDQKVASTRLTLGSAEGAGFLLTDRTVSAVHCEILADQTGFRVRDLGSRNGVYLSSHRVSEAWLRAEEDLQLGDTVLRFKVDRSSTDEPLAKRASFGRLRGGSVRMRELYAHLASAAKSDASVLIQGETGTGKELAAEALVLGGPRRDGPFVVIDCGALPLQLAESELFGHEAGAYTGAAGRVLGAFERAHRGTAFLDEVGELHPELQPKLLGALERKSIQRVGGSARIDVDVRVVAATHRDLAREVNRGTFRADLFYRLGAIEIRMPALREHAEDIPELVSHFLEQLPKAPHLAPAVLEGLYRREWPGNVRELLNAVERAAIGLEERGAPATPAPAVIAPDAPFRLQKERLIAAFEHDYALKLLDACGGNVAEASRRSGLSRVNLYGLFRRARVTPEEHRG